MKPYTVRGMYIAPKDTPVWTKARRQLDDVLQILQGFFAHEMRGHGYDPKTFEIDRKADGLVVFDTYTSPIPKSEFQASPWKTCKQVLGGGRASNATDIELCFFEGYSIVNGVVICPGAFNKRRRCYLNSLYLKMANKEWLACQDGYGERVFDWISKDRMKSDTLSWNRRGKELGDVSGAAFGVIAHELAHSFGLDDHGSPEDVRERKGNLMGTGMRGFRGAIQPDSTSDSCVLDAPDASILNASKFFKIRDLTNSFTG
jgi:hypothetical protein